MTGILAVVSRVGGSGGFAGTTRTYSVGTNATETVPAGATNVLIEVWGGGGGGSGGIGSPTNVAGEGGDSAAYSRSSYAVTAGQTLKYTCGAAGAAGAADGGGGGAGGASSVSSGTKVVTTMTANGPINNGSTAPTASGGNQANVSGNLNTTAQKPGMNGPAGVNGSWGSGGAGGSALGGAGQAGDAGRVVFTYS